jgi:E3 ubiquitin-protein ligase DOA10
MSTTSKMDEQGDHECRVCRMGEEESRPLYTPCQCNGSIGLVHQDCLEAWLLHSKKDSCELCNIKYQFEGEYAPNTPATVPLTVMLHAIGSMMLFKAGPYACKIILAIFVWLVCIPMITVYIYDMFLGRTANFFVPFTIEIMFVTLQNGVIIDITLFLAVLVLVSVHRLWLFFKPL